MKLATLLERDNNNFDLLRLCAALAVIFGHAFALHPNGGWHEPVRRLLGFTYSGSLAVDLFFFLSGILVTGSFCQSKSYTRFCLMRFSRIWPGLAVCLIISTICVGSAVTTLSIGDYLVTWQTRWYVLTNIRLNSIVYTLPGVFEENYYKGAVNGSLWTLPIEIRCYAVAFIAGITGFFKTAPRVLIFAFLSILLVYFLPNLLGYLRADAEQARMPLLFLFGMVCYASRARIPIDFRLSLIALPIAVTFSSSTLGRIAFYGFFLNTALVISSYKWLRRFRPPGDYSYGIYIYGFVIQQIVSHYFPAVTSYPSLLISIPATTLVAILSWTHIERPALNYGRSLSSTYERYRTQAGNWLTGVWRLFQQSGHAKPRATNEGLAPQDPEAP